MIKHDTTRAGFTIVELMVVIAITALLSAILLANTRSSSRDADLRREAQILAADFRKAQGLAISASSAQCGLSTLVPYYGVRIKADIITNASYFIYADCNRDYEFDSGSDDFIVDTIVFDKVFVNATSPSSGGTDWLEVVYIPPVPEVAIDGALYTFPATGSFTVGLCHRAEVTACITLKGNTSGNIEVQ